MSDPKPTRQPRRRREGQPATNRYGFTAALLPTERERMEARAREAGISVNQFAERAIRAALA